MPKIKGPLSLPPRPEQKYCLISRKRFASDYMCTLPIFPKVLLHALYFILAVISRYRHAVFQEPSGGSDALPGVLKKALFHK